jgi:AraC-like DNA-binding protein
MNFYRDEVTRLSKVLYPHNDLTKQIIESRHFIDKHFSEDINLDKIAGKALVSKFHFIRVFKRYFGRTPNQYLQEVRIEMAKKILLKGKSIDEVCNAIGFKSKTSFISLFKKMTGVTPLAFQNKKSNFE